MYLISVSFIWLQIDGSGERDPDYVYNSDTVSNSSSESEPESLTIPYVGTRKKAKVTVEYDNDDDARQVRFFSHSLRPNGYLILIDNRLQSDFKIFGKDM